MKSQESLKRPISGSDFGYEIPLKDPRSLEAIMSKEDLTGEGTTDIDGDASDVDKYVVILLIVHLFRPILYFSFKFTFTHLLIG